MNIVVYTAVIGNIDKLWSICPATTNAKFVAFVDSVKTEVGTWGGVPSTIKSLTGKPNGPRWEQVIVDAGTEPRRAARYYKAMPHLFFAGVDAVIWVDGNVRLRNSPEVIVEKYLKGEIATFNHPERSNVYSESEACIRFGKDKSSVLRAQVEDYRKKGLPPDSGLAETRVVIRKITPQIVDLDERWWAQIKFKSVRDQVSFPYICWRLGIKWDIIDGRCLGDRHRDFLHLPHRSGKK